MGNCLSGAPARLIEDINGNEDDYHNRFMEDAILGEGEFGQVRMVHDMKINNSNSNDNNNNVPYACKLLRKGVVFKDNTLYSPIKPAVLRGEVEMLRCLQGKEYCLKLIAIYETPRVLYMITEYCGGGEMMEYVSHLKTDLTIVQVSRIAYQLLSALHHCATHKVIHRDVKPENCMFHDPTPSAEIRLIDFGSGTFIHPPVKNTAEKNGGSGGLAHGHTVDNNDDTNDDLIRHTTFAGSAFYISPEMFQRSYTYKTDVWSAGATLYVLVAGYPADELQKAFNILQTKNRHVRKLRDLPNLPLDDLPESFFQLLEGLLTYRHKSRPSAGEMRQSEFCQLHKKQQQAATMELQEAKEADAEDNEEEGLSLEQVSAAAAAAAADTSGIMGGGGSSSLTQGRRLSLAGTAGRHQLFLGFKKYERSLTALMAAVLSKAEFAQLLAILKKRQVLEQTNNNDANATGGSKAGSTTNNDEDAIIVSSDPDESNSNLQASTTTISAAAASLSVIPVRELKLILQEDVCNEQVITTMEKLPGADLYDGFAYHVALLREFASGGAGDDLSESSNMSASGRKRLRRRTQLRRNLSFSGNAAAGGGGSARGGNMFADDSSLNGGSASGSVQGRRKKRDSTVNSRGTGGTPRSTNKKLSSSVSGGRLFGASSRGR